MTVTIHIGDCLKVLPKLPAESVNCVVTSPPYWGLRDYGVEGIGLEPTLVEHIENMVGVFQEVRRVLRKDGTVWLNYGDCYFGSAGSSERRAKDSLGVARPKMEKVCEACGREFVGTNKRRFCSAKCGGTDNTSRATREIGLKPKDLCMLPARIALALQADGWWIRSEIVWAKPNPMPESVTDRPTSAHEKIYLLTKSPRYFFDQEAVREPPQSGPSDLKKMAEGKERIGGKHKVLDDPLSKASAATNIGQKRSVGDPSGRNIRNVWTIATQLFSEAHFATFPPALIEPCIKAGCPKGGVVLDPFGGAGTTGLVADRLGRDAILIELNPEYAEMAKGRIETDGGMFTEVALEAVA